MKTTFAGLAGCLRLRGFRLEIDRGKLLVRPASKLTEDDRRQIKAGRDE